MSLLNEQDVICTKCQYPNKAEVWAIINVREDPELKDILLGGELNMVECSACKKIFHAERFMIYHDPENEIMAFVYPHNDRAEREKWEKKTHDDFSQTQTSLGDEDRIPYDPVTLFGLDELVGYVDRDEEMKIQSEIVSVLAQQQGFPLKQLRPSLARKQAVPPLLPFLPEPNLPERDSLIKALSKVVEINDRLTAYSGIRSRLMENPSFQIQFEKVS